jgi:outer membrane biosynthesis protein TonB
MTFETKKNVTAGSITLLLCALLLLLFMFVQWIVPTTPAPTFEEGIEVNLGNSETGLGNIAPEIPGEASNTTATENSTPPPTTNETTTTINGDENETDEAATIPTKATTKPLPSKPIITQPTENKPKPVVTNPTPPAPKPKALMGKYNGGNASGGNNADSYNGVNNQGVAGGNGDQGKPNGNPNSDSYTGNASSGNSGVSIRTGLDGRRFTKLPSFEDEFNENAKVAVDITVNENGAVTDAAINPKGTTTTNGNIRSIALRKAKQLKLNTGSSESTGTIVFNFKLKG